MRNLAPAALALLTCASALPAQEVGAGRSLAGRGGGKDPRAAVRVPRRIQVPIALTAGARSGRRPLGHAQTSIRTTMCAVDVVRSQADRYGASR